LELFATLKTGLDFGRIMMKKAPPSDEMKCPRCGRLELRMTAAGVQCKICGYTLSPGESDKYRLYQLLREESKTKK
jgi:ribosomal protein L37AE/L43A